MPIPYLVLGCANVGPQPPCTPSYTHNSVEKVREIMNCWRELGGHRLDTAAYYGITDEQGVGGSESMLAKAGLTGDDRFIIDTKVSIPSHSLT